MSFVSIQLKLLLTEFMSASLVDGKQILLLTASAKLESVGSNPGGCKTIFTVIHFDEPRLYD